MVVRSAVSPMLDTFEWDNLPASNWKMLETKFTQYTNLINIYHFRSNSCYQNQPSLKVVLYPDPPTEEIEKGSGQKGHNSLSPRMKSCRANQIEERCHMTNGMLITPLCVLVDCSTECVRMRCDAYHLYLMHTHKRKLGQGSATLSPDPFLIFSVGGSGYDTNLQDANQYLISPMQLVLCGLS